MTKESTQYQWSTDVKGLEEETASILQKYGKPKAKSRSSARHSYNITPIKLSVSSRNRELINDSSLTPDYQSLSSNDDYLKKNELSKKKIAAAAQKIQRLFRSKLCKKTDTLRRSKMTKEDDHQWNEGGGYMSPTDHNHPRLFKEDGSSNLSLRAAVAEALKTHRFDNVSTISLYDQYSSPGETKRGSQVLSRGQKKTILNAEKSTPEPNIPYNQQHLFCSDEKKLVSNLSFTRKPNRSSARKQNKQDKQGDLLSLRNVHYPGFESTSIDGPTVSPSREDGSDSKRKEVCFNCWSASKKTECKLYKNISSKDDNLQICDMWGIRFLRQCYRCEDIERRSSTDLSALRFVKDSRRRSAIPEHQSHPIFKSLSKHIAIVNFRARRRFHVRQWFQSFINILKLNIIEGAHSLMSGKNLRDRGTNSNIILLRSLSNQIRNKLPSAPVTETDRAENSIITTKKCLTEKGMVEKRLIIPGPIPIPVSLYEPRVYKMPPQTKIKLYDSDNHINHYALFGKKQTPNNMAVGGLSGEVILTQEVHKYIAPEYGDFNIKDTTISIPNITMETYVPPETLIIEASNLVYVERELQHALNTRRAPTITIKVGISPNDKHYFGLNRPEQTGEIGYCGFRTSESSELPPLDCNIVTSAFVPSCEISSPNTPKQLPPVTTKADLNYPFCDTKSRQNSIHDLEYLLDTIQPCTYNKPQTFTVMTLQEPGKFMRNYDLSLPLGRLRSNITRSWSFLQKRRIAKFVTRNGVPYWYDRRAGQTFWERPLCDEEMKSVKKGGVFIGSRNNDYLDEKMDYNNAIRSRSIMRKIILSQKQSSDTSKIRDCPVSIDTDLLQQDETLEGKPTNDLYVPQTQKKHSTRDNDVLSSDEGLLFDNVVLSIDDKEDTEEIIELNKKSKSKPDTNRDETFTSVSVYQREMKDQFSPKITFASDEPNEDENNSTINFVDEHRNESKTEEEDGIEFNEKSDSSLPRHDQDEIEKRSSKLISSITQVLGGMLKDLSNEEDILKLGVGLGMSLGAQGVLAIDEENHILSQGQETKISSKDASVTSNPDHFEEKADSPQPDTFPIIFDGSPLNEKDDCQSLSPEQKLAQKTYEQNEMETEIDLPLQKSYATHKINDLGILSEDAAKKNNSTLRTLAEPVAQGFLNVIKSRRVGTQHVDYIPSSPNLPQCKPVGRIKPRSAGKDWLQIGFDPWSTGKELLNVEFVPFLVVGSEEENNMIPLSAPNDAVSYLNRENNEESNSMKSKFKQLCSCVRHGNYTEFEQMLDDCDGIVPIDYADDVGNTLLMVSCQNGNKRMVKLCLRKGSDMNKQNTNGHTCLHYAFGYGFHELGAYLISKGADDSVANAEGLTCYEGLRIEDISSL